MEAVDTLQRIIKEEGNCCWATPETCLKCPLGKLKKRDDGSWRSCIESVGVENLAEKEADAKYKEAAIRALAELHIDRILEEQ